MAALQDQSLGTEKTSLTTAGESTDGIYDDRQPPSNKAQKQVAVVVVANGDIQVEERSIAVPGGGNILEMQCTTSHKNDKGGDVTETYSSKLSENTKVENGSLVKERLYEETAEKCNKEKTDTGEEKADTSRLLYEESEKIREIETGAKLKEFCASKQEELNTSVTSTDHSGPAKRSVTRSRNSFSKSCVKHETLLDSCDDVSVTADLTLRNSLLDDSTTGSYVNKIMAATQDKPVESYFATSSKSDHSENKYEAANGEEKEVDTSSSHNGEAASTSIDLGKLGETKLSTAGSSSDSDSYSGGASTPTVNKSVFSEESSHKQESQTSDIKENGVMSSSSSLSSSAHALIEENFSSASASTMLTNDSGICLTDKLIDIDGPSSVHSARPGTQGRGTPPFSGPYEYAEDRHSANELIRRILADSDLEPSPRPTRRADKVKIDMGAHGQATDSASVTTEESDDRESSLSGSFATGADRRQGPPTERPSLLERRLENMKPANRYGDPENDQGEIFLNEETMYLKKRKPVDEAENDFEAEIRKKKKVPTATLR